MNSPAAFRYSVDLDDSSPRDQQVRELVESWLAIPALREIVTAHGGPWPEGDLGSRLEALNDFSQAWDFRSGGERLDIIADSEIEEELIEKRAPDLGMTVSQAPTKDAYDHALILGGTALASVNRIRRLSDLVEGGLRVKNIAALTALRDLPANEVEIAAKNGVGESIVAGAESEFDVMLNATAELLAGGSDREIETISNENPNLRSASASFDSGRIQVLAAPSGDPERRANTLDNYSVYESAISPGDSVLVVTSSIYLPYQFFTAVKSMGFDRNLTLEAVGFPPEWMNGILTAPRNVLQELRSAFFGAKNLVADAGD